jgi:hypothetical protein
VKTKQLVSAISVTTVLALGSAAQAGVLGAGGGLGGSMGMGGVGFGGHGGFDSSFDSMNTRASAQPAKRTADKAETKTNSDAHATAATAGAAGRKIGNASASTSDAAAERTGDTASGVSPTARGAAVANVPAQSARAEQPRPDHPANSAGGEPATRTSEPAAPREPGTSFGMTGLGAVNAGQRNVSGSESGSIDAQRSPGATSAAASGNVAASATSANSPPN